MGLVHEIFTMPISLAPDNVATILLIISLSSGTASQTQGSLSFPEVVVAWAPQHLAESSFRC